MIAGPFIGFALALWMALLFIGERIWVADPPPAGRLRRLLRNGAMALIAAVTGPLLLMLAASIAGRVPPLLDLAPLGLPAMIAIQFVALDIWTYWMHRAYHRVPLLWRLHAPHHLDEHLDTTSALRFHAAELALSALMRLIPAIALGIEPGTLFAFDALLLANTAFHHSNLALPPRFEQTLSRLVVTPSIHWVHHHKIRADTDSNYTAILSVWDRLFGSANPRPRIPGMAIGVEGEADRALPALLAYPLRRRSGTASGE